MAGTELYGPFDSQPWADQTQWYRFGPTWAPSGVIDVAAASASAGSLGITFSALTPTISAGRAWVRGAGYELSGGAKTMAAVAANTNASLSRRDRIVLRRDLSAKTVTLVALQGTPASTPVAPALTQVETGQWDLPLFSFLVPPNSGTTVTGIVDERTWTDPGGVSTSGRVLLVADQTSTANATNTTPVAIAGIDGQTVTLTGPRKLTITLHAQTCEGSSGGELGRVTLGAGSYSRRTQFFAPSGGTQGEVTATVILSGTFSAGTVTIGATLLRVIGGSQVTVSNAELVVTDGGPA